MLFAAWSRNLSKSGSLRGALPRSPGGPSSSRPSPFPGHFANTAALNPACREDAGSPAWRALGPGGLMRAPGSGNPRIVSQNASGHGLGRVREVTVGVGSLFQVHTMRESVPPDADLTWPERMQDSATWGSDVRWTARGVWPTSGVTVNAKGRSCKIAIFGPQASAPIEILQIPTGRKP